jgi:DNA-binding NarL/FixJ family response regulator
VRVMIADDHPLIRDLIARHLGSNGFEVAGVASDRDEILAMVRADPPDVVVVDVRMPPNMRDDGLLVAETLRLEYSKLAIVVLSDLAVTGYAMRLVRRSAKSMGYLVKGRVESPEYLVEAIRRVATGGTAIDSEIVRQMTMRPRVDNPLDELTGSELQVLMLIAEGLTDKGIAARLGPSSEQPTKRTRSVKTIEKRISSILQKLGLSHLDRAEVNVRVVAVLEYLRHIGLPTPEDDQK